MSLEKDLLQILPAERVKTRLIDRYAYASDASHFYLVPQAVVQPNTIEEVRRLFAFAHEQNIHLTFRAGGTSLSGQAVTDGILVDLSNYWRQVTPEEDGRLVRVQPAVIGAHVNLALQAYGRKMGPDPASINAAMMGGILSNNSSGMCCGVEFNSYHTLRAMTFVLPNGLVFNTENPEDYPRFEREAPALFAGLRQMRLGLFRNKELMERIRKKYRQKNTVGYCMNAFVDYEHPLDILAHLIIGGEGTLAFIAEAVLETIPDYPQKMTAMLYFDSPAIACNAIYELKKTGARALEFMDRASLRSVEDMPGVPEFLRTLPGEASAILIEFQESTPEELRARYAAAKSLFDELPLLFPPDFTQDPAEQALLWKIRKGMYPSVAGMRAKGTSALMEDFTFPVERLGEAVVDVQKLFDKHGYENGIIFGHAKDGNLHFVISQSYATPEDIAHYEKFNDDLFDLVLNKYDGALKGEHSSGRAVSAYIAREWGPEAYEIMRWVKRLVDPANLLNPGIVITEDPLLHIHHLKVMPVVEEEVDRCIECGFCESACPSRDLTLTPRQRIGVRRAIERAAVAGDVATQKALLQDYTYEGLETCATDGMCATKCPVDINTGDLVKRLRRENHSKSQNRLALQAAKHFAWLERAARMGLKTGSGLNRLLGAGFMPGMTTMARKILPVLPNWSEQFGDLQLQYHLNGQLDKAATPSHSPLRILYFPSCISRMMSGEVIDAFQSVCKKAQVEVVFPKKVRGNCCGQIFSSKGFAEAYRYKANEALEEIWAASEGGSLLVVTDVSSCTQTLVGSRNYLTPDNQQRFDTLQILDIIDFAADHLLGRLKITRPKDRIVFHPVCSAQKMGLTAKLQAIGDACAARAEIPVFAACCGMAGDRGFLYPELTAAATKREAAEVRQLAYDGYYSTSKTCEMALSEAVGVGYESVVRLLDEVS